MKNSPIIISAYLAELKLLKQLIENLVSGNHPGESHVQDLQPGWNEIEISSLEASTSVTLHLFQRSSLTKMRSDTGFLFTCTKRKGCDYEFRWASSLS